MLKKSIALFLACSIFFLLPACSVHYEGPAQAQGPGVHNGALASLLTPDGANVITDAEDLLILESAKQFPDLVLFYKTILTELYVEETGVNDIRAGIWIYSGIYDRTKPITIEMRDNIENVRVYIIY